MNSLTLAAPCHAVSLDGLADSGTGVLTSFLFVASLLGDVLSVCLEFAI